MKGESMRKTKGVREDEIRALKRMKDREVDTSDIPPVLDWSKAVAGKFYRPEKKSLTIQLDSDRSRLAERARKRLSDTSQCPVAKLDGEGRIQQVRDPHQ